MDGQRNKTLLIEKQNHSTTCRHLQEGNKLMLRRSFFNDLVAVGIQDVFRGFRSPHVHRSFLDPICSSCFGGVSICSLLFDVNDLGTKCSLF